MSTAGKEMSKLQIFRGEYALGLVDSGMLSINPLDSEAAQEGMKQFAEAGFHEGHETRVLLNIPGFSLVWAWFKKDYPLPLHTHNADCLYYVIAGSVQVGSETLGPRDGFFIKADTPYSFRPGPDGVEIVEFRHATLVDYTNLARNPGFYEKGVAVIKENVERWREVAPPSQAS